MNMNKTMKAARLYELGKPLVIDEVPIPELNDDDVLVEVKATFVAPSMKDISQLGGNFIRPSLPTYFRFRCRRSDFQIRKKRKRIKHWTICMGKFYALLPYR